MQINVQQACMCSVCGLPGCKCPHLGHFQAASIMSLNAVLRRGVHCRLGRPQQVLLRAFPYSPTCARRGVSEQSSRSRSCLLGPTAWPDGSACGQKSTSCRKSISRGRTWGLPSCETAGGTPGPASAGRGSAAACLPSRRGP